MIPASGHFHSDNSDSSSVVSEDDCWPSRDMKMAICCTLTGGITGAAGCGIRAAVLFARTVQWSWQSCAQNMTGMLCHAGMYGVFGYIPGACTGCLAGIMCDVLCERYRSGCSTCTGRERQFYEPADDDSDSDSSVELYLSSGPDDMQLP